MSKVDRMAPDMVQQAVKAQGMCGELTIDGTHACLKDPGHEGKHGDDDKVEREATPRPWKVIIESEYGDMGVCLGSYVEGIQSADGRWVVRFDDDYGTNQWADAHLIVGLVNAVADNERTDG